MLFMKQRSTSIMGDEKTDIMDTIVFAVQIIVTVGTALLAVLNASKHNGS